MFFRLAFIGYAVRNRCRHRTLPLRIRLHSVESSVNMRTIRKRLVAREWRRNWQWMSKYVSYFRRLRPRVMSRPTPFADDVSPNDLRRNCQRCILGHRHATEHVEAAHCMPVEAYTVEYVVEEFIINSVDNFFESLSLNMRRLRTRWVFRRNFCRISSKLNLLLVDEH
jgi:hypothetical protein